MKAGRSRAWKIGLCRQQSCSITKLYFWSHILESQCGSIMTNAQVWSAIWRSHTKTMRESYSICKLLFISAIFVKYITITLIKAAVIILPQPCFYKHANYFLQLGFLSLREQTWTSNRNQAFNPEVRLMFLWVCGLINLSRGVQTSDSVKCHNAKQESTINAFIFWWICPKVREQNVYYQP